MDQPAVIRTLPLQETMPLQLVQLSPQRAHPETRMSLQSSQVQALVRVDQEMGDEPRESLRAEEVGQGSILVRHARTSRERS